MISACALRLNSIIKLYTSTEFFKIIYSLQSILFPQVYLFSTFQVSVFQLYSPLNIFIALVGVVIWSENDEIQFSTNGDTTLTNFLHYRREKLIKTHPNDNAQLLTWVAHVSSYVITPCQINFFFSSTGNLISRMVLLEKHSKDRFVRTSFQAASTPITQLLLDLLLQLLLTRWVITSVSESIVLKALED